MRPKIAVTFDRRRSPFKLAQNTWQCVRSTDRKKSNVWIILGTIHWRFLNHKIKLTLLYIHFKRIKLQRIYITLVKLQRIVAKRNKMAIAVGGAARYRLSVVVAVVCWNVGTEIHMYTASDRRLATTDH